MKTEMAILSRRPIPLAIMLYEQFIYISHRLIYVQFLSTQQHAYQSSLVTCWFNSVCVTVTRWVNFREKYLHEYELQLFDHNV